MPAATLRRISMKALARHQVILFGEQRHIRCCRSTASLPVRPQCPNARQNRYQEDLNSFFPLKNWRRPPGHPCTTWTKTIQQGLKSNNLTPNEAIGVAQKFRTVHAGDWCLRLALRTPSGARQKWMMPTHTWVSRLPLHIFVRHPAIDEYPNRGVTFLRPYTPWSICIT